MNRLTINRLFAVIFYLSLLLPVPGMAQRAIGIDWQQPGEASQAAAELRYFSGMGISYLQVDQPLPSQTWQLVEQLEFNVYGKLPLRFPVTQTFLRADSSFNRRMDDFITHFDKKPSVQGIGLFSYSPRHDTDFREAAAAFIQSARTQTQKSLYHITAVQEPAVQDSLFDFRMIAGASPGKMSKAGAFLYKPAPGSEWDLRPVKQLLENMSDKPGIPVFFDSSWLKVMFDKYPRFKQTLQLYATSSDPVFPLPRQTEHGINSNTVVVVMLILVWILFAATYSYYPIYRKSFLRYFTGHKFYVDDVMQRHIRALVTGCSILIQHSIAGGIVFYCLFHTTFSPLGYQALYAHYPLLTIFGAGALGLFVWGCLFALLIKIISIVWLWAANSQTGHLSQVINLYPWLLQLNLLLATIIAAFFLAGQNNLFIYPFAVLFLLIFIGSFIITSFDTARYISSNRIWFYTGTAGIYSLLLIGCIIWVAASPKLLNILELAASLP